MVKSVEALVIGSGAAGLAAALRLHELGVKEVRIVTEGLKRGTSINTGSDKQTYYKLSLYGEEADSPVAMAKTYVEPGSMHGDLALVEAAYSTRCFSTLANLGVPFPTDRYGQFIGYKTDHDPRRRATSCGPYTSREMCRALIRAVQRAGIPIDEGKVVVDLLVSGGQCHGAIAMDETTGRFTTYLARNTVFAVGGPGGLYKASVYPHVHNGAIGVALRAGALARSLPESQYGLASTAFRWNVSGTYMQVLPRLVSTDAKGGDPREFLYDTFAKPGEAESLLFLKGYQWPFDVRKSAEGSSQIDLLVYRETVEKGRRVWLDYRSNPAGIAKLGFRNEELGIAFRRLSPEAYGYLEKSGALFGIPIERLEKMNPGAVALYRDHGIDLRKEMLEVAVCAQHNNGGLAGNLWYESENIRRLFPIGEVNGSHGVARPGGSALNAGQVGAFRAAEYIANAKLGMRNEELGIRDAEITKKAMRLATEAATKAKALLKGKRDWKKDIAELRERMSKCGAHLRDAESVEREEKRAKALCRAIEKEGYPKKAGTHGLTALQMAFAHWAYLSAIKFQIASGVGSRGSALVLKDGTAQPEDTAFRGRVLTTAYTRGTMRHAWHDVRPLPATEDGWFEAIWAQYRAGEIYKQKSTLRN